MSTSNPNLTREATSATSAKTNAPAARTHHGKTTMNAVSTITAAEAVASPLTPAAPESLAQVISKAKAAWDAFGRVCDHDESAAAIATYEAANTAAELAADTLADHPVRSIAELAKKVAALRSIDYRDDYMVETIEADLARWQAAPVTDTTWHAAQDRLRRERQAMNEDPSLDTPEEYWEAAREVLTLPAPDGSALAYKIGVLSISDSVLTRPDACFDEVAGEFRDRPALDALAAADGGDEPLALLSFYDDAQRLGGPPEADDTEAWDAAVKVYESLLAADSSALDVWSTADDAARAATPVPDVLKYVMAHHDGWRSQTWYSSDESIDAREGRFQRSKEWLAQSTALKTALAEWDSARAKARKKMGVDTAKQRQREAREALETARAALLETPAPTAKAVAYKMEVAAIEGDPGCGRELSVATDLGWELTNGPFRPFALVYLDIIHLAGGDREAIREAAIAANEADLARMNAEEAEAEERADEHFDGFKPVEWMEELRREGVYFFTENHGGISARFPAPDLMSPRLREMAAERAADPSKIQSARYHYGKIHGGKR